MEQAPVKIGQYVLGKNLGIGAFGKVSELVAALALAFFVGPSHRHGVTY